MSLFHASTCFEHKCSSSGGQNCTIQSLVSSHLYILILAKNTVSKKIVVSHSNTPIFVITIFKFHKMKCRNTKKHIYLNNNQLDALNFIMSLFHASTCFEHMFSSSGGQIVLYSLWYHHTYRWLSRAPDGHL